MKVTSSSLIAIAIAIAIAGHDNVVATVGVSKLHPTR